MRSDQFIHIKIYIPLDYIDKLKEIDIKIFNINKTVATSLTDREMTEVVLNLGDHIGVRIAKEGGVRAPK